VNHLLGIRLFFLLVVLGTSLEGKREGEVSASRYRKVTATREFFALNSLSEEE
jgi:hypothetical protein